MICSMTAFARADRHLEGFSLAWEIKSVNHRYLEVSPRLPDTLRALENGARDKCRQALARGKVEITLRYQQIDSDVELELNEPLVKKLSDVSRRVGDLVQHSGQVNPMEILRYPGVLSSYPNFIFNVPASEVSAFVDAMEQARNDKPAFDRIVQRWGVRRSHPLFWTYFHDLDRYIQETEPQEAGVLDMNRYENL